MDSVTENDLSLLLFVFGIPLIAIGYYQCSNDLNTEDEYITLNYSMIQQCFQKGNIFQLVVGISCLTAFVVNKISNIISTKNTLQKLDTMDDYIENQIHENAMSMAKTNSTHEIIAKLQTIHVETTVNIITNETLSPTPKNNTASDQHKSSPQIYNTIASTLDALGIKCSTIPKNKVMEVTNQQFYLKCQEGAYMILRNTVFSTKDRVVSSCLSLLALISKYDCVRDRILYQADMFGLDVQVQAIKDALNRTKQYSGPKSPTTITTSDITSSVTKNNTYNDIPPEHEEYASAEVQRRACLCFGALADESEEMSTLIVQEGGLECILNAIDWFRYHVDVVNWAFWSIFNICYDHVGNKSELIRLDGLQKICRVMNCIICDLQDHSNDEVTDDDDANVANKRQEQNNPYMSTIRHGIAILFDLLRYPTDGHGNTTSNVSSDSSPLNVTKIRIVAMNCGIQKIVKDAISTFPHSKEIVMMGQQMQQVLGMMKETS